MAQTPSPPWAPEDISPVRLHGHACYQCGAVDTPLFPAGDVCTPVEEGLLRIWAVSICRPCGGRP